MPARHAYPEFKQLNLSEIGKEILAYWETHQIFEKSVSLRQGKDAYVFYEGPPSANGMPGIHHVMARAIKDIFCRFQTLNGKQVKRKAGWDTHGLPIELAVEKSLGITKEDIGKKISVEAYNEACRKEVMKYTDKWEELTLQMGYWVDLHKPYITYENTYIESVWWLLHKLYSQQLLYKGFTIQPYSPAAGTGLSSHELNQPGCYRNVKDRTAVAMFKVIRNEASASLFNGHNFPVYFLAWTTTPWTLPSNTALAVGAGIEYTLVKTFAPFSGEIIYVILAKELLTKYFVPDLAGNPLKEFKPGDKHLPWHAENNFSGNQLAGMRYEQLLPFAQPDDGDAFKVITGDFVTTEDGTGIVHIAPSFGADDFKVARQNEIGSLTLVDKRGRFLDLVKDDVFLYGGEYVKEAYLSDEEKELEWKKQKQILESKGKIKELKNHLSVDERIVLKLQEEGKLFKKETYEHSYPHCWRTDKPVLYYPLDSWFVKVTAQKDRLVELNKQINWKPESTGTGRFGNWLENANDWNLSRSRFWGIPLPIWRSEDGEEKCIDSVATLKKEIEQSVSYGYMKNNPLEAFVPGNFSKENYNVFDLHKPYADDIILVSPKGKPMYREKDLIDVWFDSGAMPYAQLHYPFENKELIEQQLAFPADFIAEGVDQTRGWFYTLHVISSLCFNSVAYKNVISNGLVLDKNGNKMSKRLGNAVDPFATIEKYGADATRWYMIANAAPWDNLKFDVEGISEVQRKLFGTLYNTYNFFALYANVDSYRVTGTDSIPVAERTELDRWILSSLQTLIAEVTKHYSGYEPHKAARAIEEFVDEHLSNWYVRLSRRRFWKGEMSHDKKAAYQTLFDCLLVTAQLMSPVAPFFSDWLYLNLSGSRNAENSNSNLASVHLTDIRKAEVAYQNKELEEQMALAQKISSMVLSLRKKENIRVRQPLKRIRIPVLNENMKQQIEAVKDLILSEVNVKELQLVNESETQIVKTIKLNFKTLGKKCGRDMKEVQQWSQLHTELLISGLEKDGHYQINIAGKVYTLTPEDVEIIPLDIPGWKVSNQGSLTVALDISLDEDLRHEGLARELVNRVQNIRKDREFDITDRIILKIKDQKNIKSAVNQNLTYICTEILADRLEFVQELTGEHITTLELDDDLTTQVSVEQLIK